MRYPNAQKGVKKVFIAEILTLLVSVLALIGAIVVVALIAWTVYKHFSDDYLDDYEDLDDIFEDEEDDADEDEDEVEDGEPEVLLSEDDFAE